MEREGEEKTGYNREEYASGDGKRLEKHVGAEEPPKDLGVVLLLVVRQNLAQKFGIFQGARELQVLLILRTDLGKRPPDCKHRRGGRKENEEDEKDRCSRSQLSTAP